MGLSKSKREKVAQQTVATRGIVSFLLSGKEYAVDMESVREVIYKRKISPLPGAPDYFEGLIDLRGTVIPVIHLGKRLNAVSKDPEAVSAPSEHILIMEIRHKKVGFIVDRVDNVVVIEKESVQKTQDMIESPLSVIEGVFRYQERLILLVRLERLFTQEDINTITAAIAHGDMSQNFMGSAAA
jgi:purine-binding chemotaxis protein CheW